MDSYIDDKHWQTVFVQHVVSSYKHLCELRLLIRCRSLAFHHFFCGFLDRFEGCWDAGGTNPAISCRDFAILHRNVASMPRTTLHHVSSFQDCTWGLLLIGFETTENLHSEHMCDYMQPRLNTERVAQALSFMNLWGLWVTKARRVKISGSQNITFSSGQWTTALTSFPDVALACRISAKGSPMP